MSGRTHWFLDASRPRPIIGIRELSRIRDVYRFPVGVVHCESAKAWPGVQSKQPAFIRYSRRCDDDIRVVLVFQTLFATDQARPTDGRFELTIHPYAMCPRNRDESLDSRQLTILGRWSLRISSIRDEGLRADHFGRSGLTSVSSVTRPAGSAATYTLDSFFQAIKFGGF